MDINEGNKLIAEFMGYNWPNNSVYNDEEVEQIKSYELRLVKYHSSWDWLMPVVEKIVEVSDNDKRLHDWFNDVPVSDIRIFRETKNDTWIAAIEFIKQYNSLK